MLLFHKALFKTKNCDVFEHERLCLFKILVFDQLLQYYYGIAHFIS